MDRRAPPARQGPHRGAASGAAVGAATVAGLYLLGFSSVFREGFETVLFLQALQLSSGTGRRARRRRPRRRRPSRLVGAVTFKLEQRLPYKKMLVVTGVLIALVLVVLVGNTMRTLQGVGWLPITPVHVEPPLWMGTWLGIFPTVETLGAQALALAFVVGSYFLAEWVRKRNLRRFRRERIAELDPWPAPSANGAGASANGAAAAANGAATAREKPGAARR